MAVVEIKGSAMLRPSGEASGETVPLTVFDMAATDGYIPNVLAFHAPAPTNEALKEGLLEAVKSFPHLAGRMVVDERNWRCFRLNNDGILVIEATASADLAEVLATNVSELYPSIEKGSADDTLFRVQLTRCRCGGLVVGTATHHQVADGHAMSSFLAAWASAVREAGTTAEAAFSVPFLDRAATVVPRHPPKPAFDHRSIEFTAEHSSAYEVLPLDSIKNLAVHFPAEFVGKLKARVGARCSTFQCILAHVWKKVTAARDLKPGEFTQVRVAVNCRGRATPPVPMGFFGNMVLWAFPRLQVRDLLSSSYTTVVATIRDAVARVDSNYVQSFVDFGEAASRDGEELVGTAAMPGTVFCPDLEVDSWLGLGFNNLDFGGGPPCAFLPPDLPIDGLMIFAPSCSAKGGVDLFMAMSEEHVKVFKQICYSLD